MSEGKKRFFIDLDGTLARFHDQVNFLERMFEKGFFRELEPFENMVEGIRLFMQQHPDVECFTLSAKIASPYCEEEKNAWLDDMLPEIDQEHRIYTEMGRSKAEFIPGGITKDDHLLDDYNKGLNLWLYDGGSSIKCHNNINQKGLGAYGGAAGMIWTGPMVHTEDSPELIAAELAQHMGLEYNLEKVVSSAKEDISYSEFKPGSRLDPYPFTPGITSYLTKVLPDKYTPQHFEARWYEPRNSAQTPHDFKRSEKQFFENPLNAVRWLEGKGEFQELQMQTSHGEKFSVPIILANALASNLYNCSLSDLSGNGRWSFPPDVADAFNLAISDSLKPVVGNVHFLGSNGKIGETAVFRSVEEMKEEIQDSFDCGRPVSVEWFVEIKPPKEVTLHCSPGLGAPEQFTLSTDILLKAAEYCGIDIYSIDEFLSEYTWDDSSRIWTEYAQYVDQLASIMEGFASREEIEEEFTEVMSEKGITPVSAAKQIAYSIENWARWHNEDAREAGVLDKAMDMRKALSGSSEKKSLNNQITSAKSKLEAPAKDPFPKSPQR